MKKITFALLTLSLAISSCGNTETPKNNSTLDTVKVDSIRIGIDSVPMRTDSSQVELKN